MVGLGRGGWRGVHLRVQSDQASAGSLSLRVGGAGPGASRHNDESDARRASFSAHDPYNQERLVYRQSPYQLDFYNYHRWAASPAEQVTDWTRNYLRGVALFAKVYPANEGAADFALNGRIRQFDEVDHDQTWEAVLGVDFWLVRADQHTPLWFQSYTVTQQAAKRNPAAIAEAMSRNLETILGKLALDLAPVVAAPSTP